MVPIAASHPREVRLVLDTALPPERQFALAAQALAEVLQLPVEVTTEFVQKAVEATPGHFRQRDRQGRYREFKVGRAQPRGPDGRYYRRLNNQEQAQAAKDASRRIYGELEPRLQRHLADQQRGGISADEWYDRVAEDLRLFYELTYRHGKQAAGDPAVLLTPLDWSVINRLVKDELDYLAGFREHLRAGKGRMPYPDRMRLYAHAAWESYWSGWVLADQRSARKIRWRYGNTVEHCHDCERFVKLDWLPARLFAQQILERGYAPRGGKLECQGHRCQCWLEEMLDGKVQPRFQPPQY